MTAIDPSTCPTDQPYEGTYEGERRTMQRIGPNGEFPWGVNDPDRPYRKWARDSEVSDLVPLVPARPLTRADLPIVREIDGLPWEADILDAADVTLDAVLNHLNARGGVPASDDEDWKARAEKAEARRPTLDRAKVYDALSSLSLFADVNDAADAVMALCDEAVTDPSLNIVTDSESDSDSDSEPEGEPLTAERDDTGWGVSPSLWGDVPFWVIDADGARKRADRKRTEADWYARAAVAIEKAEADEKRAEAMERAKAEAAEIAHLEMGARWLFEHNPGYGGTAWDDVFEFQRDAGRDLFHALPAAAKAAILDAAREGGAA